MSQIDQIIMMKTWIWAFLLVGSVWAQDDPKPPTPTPSPSPAPFEYPFFFNGSSQTWMNLTGGPFTVKLYAVKERTKDDKPESPIPYLGQVLESFKINSTEVEVAATQDEDIVGRIVTNDLKITYKKLDLAGTHNDKSRILQLGIQVSLTLNLNSSRWILDSFTADYHIKLNGTEDLKKEKVVIKAAPKAGYSSNPADIAYSRGYTTGAPRHLVWACNNQEFAANLTGSPDQKMAIAIVMPGLKLQPFFGNHTRQFGYEWNCDPIFSTALWEFILIGLFFLFILYSSVAMLGDLKTPERFDDPKGKALHIPASD